MRKLILKQFQSPGDILMLTAAVRDLHLTYPGEFLTDVRTHCDELWENNPYITNLNEDDPTVEIFECEYPLIHRSNHAPYHMIHGFIEYFNDRLGLQIKPTVFHGDIHLTEDEKSWTSQIEELAGVELPYWIVAAGGKHDVTIKWWQTSRYQQVVNSFKDKVVFVQVGASNHHHPKLNNVIDLRGQTSLRQLVRLVYHSQGVLCPVTFLMHLAASVPVKSGVPKNRPCVVVAGGREPSHWEAYPHHQFIHTNGALACCDQGGCWKSRVRPLGDGDERDNPEHLCVDVVNNLPKCMHMISAKHVSDRIRSYFIGGVIAYLNSVQARVAKRTIKLGDQLSWNQLKMEIHAFRRAADQFISRIPNYSNNFKGRGIVICAGGEKYFPCAWVCIKMLRLHGCTLPIELWFSGAEEMDSTMQSLVRPLGVECVDATQVAEKNSVRTLKGWPLKAYAVLHSRFREVMSLDADNVPLRNPEYLFKTAEFKAHGAIFWPDIRPPLQRNVWAVFGAAYMKEPEFESGQFLIDKSRCLSAIQLSWWYNNHSDFYYQYVLGDKETFHMAFRRLKIPYAMVPERPKFVPGVLYQHDFSGGRIFQHRNGDKWRLDGQNWAIPEFQFEAECRRFLADLRRKWNGNVKTEQSRTSDKASRTTIKSGKRRRQPLKSRSVHIKAPLNNHTGYGQHAGEIIKFFNSRGYSVEATSSERSLQPLQIKDLHWQLVVHPPSFPVVPSCSTALFTMWETSRLPTQSLNNLNAASAVIVPCQWNAICFTAQGVRRPIYQCPLGIDPEKFRPIPFPVGEICVFGAAGNASISGRTRKGLDDVIKAFTLAFPKKQQDVRLKIKCAPGDSVGIITDSRIQIDAKFLSDLELAQWYASLTCFVSAAKAEAWGLMQHQAMAVGRPVIACQFGGLAEFFDESVGFPVEYSLENADERYAGLGLWAKPNLDSLVEQLRYVYNCRAAAKKRAEAAAGRAQQFTWQRSNTRLLDILCQAGML